MASRTFPDGADPASYRGLPSIYEFINSDGNLRRYNCGHAAGCSFLTFAGAFPNDPAPELAHRVIASIEEQHPPDNMGGWFGASRRRIERMCRTNGVPFTRIRGENALRASLAAGRPVVVVIGTEGPRVLGWPLPTAHWMVAYGYDDQQIFLTNWSSPGMPWPEFRRWWSTFVPRLVSMNNRGLALTT
jgi:hypothetical protein